MIKLSPFRAGLLLFAIAFLVRIAFILVYRPYLNLGRFELERVAISLATSGLYGNPYAVPTGPTAHVSPGYTLILAAIFRLFGTGVPAEVVKELLATVVTALSCALLPSIADVLALSRETGILAGFVCALYPERPLVQVDGDWETPYTVLALMLVSILVLELWRRQRLTVGNAAFHGLCWGIILLFVAAMLPVFLAFIAVGAYFCRHSGLKRYAIFSAAEILFVALCLAPWAIRNYHALGSPILTRTNFGLEMRVSNNDKASPNERINSVNGVYAAFHPLQNVAESLKVRELGEVAYNRIAMEQARGWIFSHPLRFLQLCLGRAGYFWFYRDRTSRAKTIFLATTVLLGFAGLVLVFRQKPLTGTVLATILLIYPLPNYLIHVGLKQEYPIHWLMVLLTFFSLRQAGQLFSSRATPSEAHASV